jgi:phospholipid transport system substrate-binding protein
MLSIRTFIAAMALALAPLTLAHADAASESFVQENANKVLQALDETGLTRSERSRKFSGFMDELSDLDGVSRFVLGKYGRRFNPDELTRYRDIYRTYSLVNYEAQFDEYRGADIEITGSVDTKRDSIVNSIIRKDDGETLKVSWRVRQRADRYQVIDVGLHLDGNLLWLAVEQRAQFLDLLDRNGGSADALIAKLEQLTLELQQSFEG